MKELKNKSLVVLVEDDQRLAELTRDFLENNGFQTIHFSTGDEAQRGCLPHQPDLIILDIMLPGMDGVSLCREFRQSYDGPILMLTAKKSDFDQVIGLEMGADDYVIKPVEPHVLLARVNALLRRSAKDKQKEQATCLTFGQLTVDASAQAVTLNGDVIELTTREFQLLWLLASHAGEIISRDSIFSLTRGLEYDGSDRSVDVRVSKLRKKLHDDGDSPQRIKTVWGKGYLFVPTAWE